MKLRYIIIAICFYLIGISMLYKGCDKMFNYHSSEYSSLNVNAYVGGDAYNYIINGNYATGFFVLAVGSIIVGTLILGIGKIDQIANKYEAVAPIYEQPNKKEEIEDKLPPL